MTDTPEHQDNQEQAIPYLTEWVTDAELIRRSGVPARIAYATLRYLDSAPHYGFPKKDKLWGNRRHWPSVQEYWRQENQIKSRVPSIRRAS